jgi:hypothetical protein
MEVLKKQVIFIKDKHCSFKCCISYLSHECYDKLFFIITKDKKEKRGIKGK